MISQLPLVVVKTVHAHINTPSLYIPPVGHHQGAPETEQAPQYRRSRSATERFAFFRRAASADPGQPSPPKMSTGASHLPANLSPRNAPDLNTIPDPRSPSPHPTAPSTPRGTERHPDLSNEVAALSAKLINAINHQTNLDDALQETRHELDTAKQRIIQLEREAKEYRDALAAGLLVRRTETEQKEERMQNTIDEERARRSSAERDKKGMEQELENLTSQLFEEANRMVAAARKEREAADRRTDQLRAQLSETETLLASHQEQLQDLKSVLQEVQMTPQPHEIVTAATAPSSPTSEVNHKVSSRTFDYPTHQRNAHSMQSLPPPESPLHFSHLIHPVVRVDHQAYEDFIALLRTNWTSASRQSSGNFGGLNVIGLALKESTSQSFVVGPDQQAGPAKSSSRTTSASNTPIPGSHSPNLSTDSTASQSALKDSRYYKRALVEDIEPTLRLDTAPGLSWLARRTVIGSVASGKLIIEPYPTRHAFHSPAYACALCGEIRTSDEHLRRFRFRTSDSDEAQRYPLCDYCLARVRTACDFTSFLREALRGHMRNGSAQDCRVAWEECIRLRERMFWSRIGGGVVPVPNVELTPRMESPSRNASAESERQSNATQASRSDSDTQSVHRADSGLSTSSEVADPSPLSEVTTRDDISDTAAEKPDAALAPAPERDQAKPDPAKAPPGAVPGGEVPTEAAEPVMETVMSPPELFQSPRPADEGPPSVSQAPTAAGSEVFVSEETPRETVPDAELALEKPSPLLSPVTAATDAADPSKAKRVSAPTPLRSSKVASLASRFAELEADSASGSPPRSPRPTSAHSTRSFRGGDAVSRSPVRPGSAGTSRSPVREETPARSARESLRDSGVKIPGSFW